MGDSLRASIPSRYVTSQLVNSALHPSGSLNQVPASAGVRAGISPVGWQVTLCDPIWHVSSRSGVATLRTAIHLLLTYLLTCTHPFNGPFPGLPRWASTRKVKLPIRISLKQETTSGSGISWAICKSASRSRQITMPVPHHIVFYRPDALPAAQPTASKHWTQHVNKNNVKYILCLQRRIYFMFTLSERHVTVCHYNDKWSCDRLSS